METQITDQLQFIEQNLPLFVEVGMRLLSATLILIVGRVLGNWAHKRMTSIQKLDKTLAEFLGKFFKYVIMAVAVITVLAQFGVQIASLLAVLGAAGLAIGLAMQGTLSNVAAGAMLLILRPFNVGDYITVGSTGGSVKSLGLFGTELATPDNVYIFMPNSQIWNSNISNYSRHDVRRQDVALGISYDDDIGKALETVLSTLKSDARIIQNNDERKVEVMVSSMGDFSINIIARFWTPAADYWGTKWAMTRAIKEALDNAGINIPFPTQTLHVANESVEKLVNTASRQQKAG